MVAVSKLTPEQARELSRKSWAQTPTQRARRIRTLKGRIASGQLAQRELDSLLKEAAREAGHGHHEQ